MAASSRALPTVVAGAGSTPEIDLLLQVSREGVEGNVRPLRSVPDVHWAELLRLAESHGVEAFLVQAVRGLASGVSAEILTRNCGQIARRNLVLARELVNVSSYLHDKKIEHIVYKGPLLGQALYGSLALRPSRDIDLLVRPEQTEEAFVAFRAIGYQDKDNLDHRQRSAAIRYASEQCFAKNGMEVDLHWRLLPRTLSRSLDTGAMWKRAVSAKLFDAELPTLSAEDNFLALCLHAGEHGWSQLSLFCDLARLVKVGPSFDWDLVGGQLRDANVRRTVDVSVLVLARYFNCAVPAQFLRREMQVELLAERVAREFWPTPERSAHRETSLAWVLERCKDEKLADRVRWITGVLLTPTMADFQAVRLPAGMYRAVRVVRLVKKAISN